MTRLTAKTSTIFIASGASTRVYHALSDVPAPLRRKLEKSTKGSQSATILIADRRGREELVRALQTGPKRQPERTPAAALPAIARKTLRNRLHLRNSLAVLIPVLLGMLMWLFFSTTF